MDKRWTKNIAGWRLPLPLCEQLRRARLVEVQREDTQTVVGAYRADGTEGGWKQPYIPRLGGYFQDDVIPLPEEVL